MVLHQLVVLEEMDHLYLQPWELLMEPQVPHPEDILLVVEAELNIEINPLLPQEQVVLVVAVVERHSVVIME